VQAASGQPEKDRFTVTIGSDVPPGVYDARVMAPLGISSARAFTVGTHAEVVREKPNTSPGEPLPLALNTVCNAFTTARAIDHYSIDLRQGQRIVVECAARGIDSKLRPVMILADADGRDLVAERRGGVLDFTAPAAGRFVVKLHDLSFKGGAEFFYRLVVQEAAAGAAVQRLPSTRPVHMFSWPPVGLPEQAALAEQEPNDRHGEAQKITLPCDIAGRFSPAADVDTYEFAAEKGEVWWVEVASERLGAGTNPAVVVQRMTAEAAAGTGRPDEPLVDILELADIAPPMKPSSNGYSYDGPPYNAGSADVLGRLEIKESGTYRLQVRDLFGGTRDDPRSIYRLVVRKPAPDFALVAWGLHMELRNGDRSAFSKPLALRGGVTVTLEVVAMRRDGFDGAITLAVEGLPTGVTATGLTIPKGELRGFILVTASETAPRGLSTATITGRATIDGQAIARSCRLASMAWPVRDASQEIPSPRLLADIQVSVGGLEAAPLSLRPVAAGVVEVEEGGTLTVPLALVRRGEVSGGSIQLRTMGAGFDKNASFELPLTSTSGTATLDLAKLKVPPGEYTLAFYGGIVTKYAPAAAPEPAVPAQPVQQQTKAPPTKPTPAPTDIAELLVSEPITIRVKPGNKDKDTGEKP